MNSIIEFRFFLKKPLKVLSTPDHIQEFETLSEAKKFWLDSDYEAMHMMEEDDEERFGPTSYIIVT